MTNYRFRGISLSKSLVDFVEKFIRAHPERGYNSLADFATDAIREKLEALGIFPSDETEQSTDPNSHGIGR